MPDRLQRVLTALPGRSLLVTAAVLLTLGLPSSAAAARFTAHLSAPNHQPIANRKWPITVKVTRGRAKLNGKVHYQFLLDGTVEATRPGHGFKHGVYHDTLVFPNAAIGHVLSLHVVVVTRYGTVTLPWWIKTRA